MNFTAELSAFQGAIISSDNVHQFSRLTAKGGNEDQINYVVESIASYLKQGQYINDNDESKEKSTQVKIFAMYIVLNADLRVLEEMVEMDGIDTVIWTIPTVPKCLMCELMWNLHMKNYIFEIIVYTYPQMGFEVAEAFIDNFKYFNPLDCLGQLKLLSSACYLANCRLHLFNFEINDLINMTTIAYTILQKCLKYFTEPPNSHKLNRLSKDELYKYLGKRLFTMFQLINECLTTFTSKLEKDLPIIDIYKLTFKEGCTKNNIPVVNVCDIPNNILVDSLNICHIAMLDSCKELVMDVSVDVFCCWSEIEEEGKSMQQIVGELCYKVRNKLITIPVVSEHPLISMIEQIARKPVEMQDMINATEDEVVLKNIKDNSDEDSKVWIKSLVHKENICFNIELLNIVESNLDKYNPEECHKLYGLMYKHIKSNSENKDYVEALSVKVFQQCTLSTKYTILDEHFNNNNFVDMKETLDFANTLTTIFNKLIATPDADLTDVLTIFLQSPQKVFTKIFILSTESNQQANIMLKVVKLLEKYANYYYNNETEPCIITIMQDIIDSKLDTEAKQNNFIGFVCGLKENNIISGSKLLLLIIMTNIHKALLAKDSYSINIQVKLLKNAYKLDELLEYRAPMLAMLAQVLDVLRWKIRSFSSVAPTTIDSTLVLQKALFDTYDSTVPENESNWLKSKLSNIQPLTMYYYRRLWNPPGANYLEVISGTKIDSTQSSDSVTSLLFQVLCSCTQQEWCDIWDSLQVYRDTIILKVFHDALTMTALAEKSNRTDKTWSCLLYCYKNFVFIIKYKYFKEPLQSNQVKAALCHLSTLADLYAPENFEDLSVILMPLLAYLLERKEEFTNNFPEYVTDILRNTVLSPIVNKLFANGSS